MTEFAGDSPGRLRTVAFYLPQFHPIPENDAWWGQGFTEWRNVGRGATAVRRPLSAAPARPTSGFYDLRVPETRSAQAELAASTESTRSATTTTGSTARRLLERPFDEVLASGEPDFPFCLCWANENWTRRLGRPATTKC